MTDHIGALQHAASLWGKDSIEALVLEELGYEEVFLNADYSLEPLAGLVMNIKDLKDRLTMILGVISRELSRRGDEILEMQMFLDKSYTPIRGHIIKRKVDVTYSPVGGLAGSPATKWLQENGYPDIAKFQVHHKRFQSVVAEVVKNHKGKMPEELAPLVDTFEKVSADVKPDKNIRK